MQYNTLDWQVEDRVLVLTLNRPDQLNSFTVGMAEELVDAFHRASEDDSVGAVIVTGAGRAFCAGMDLTRAGNVFGLDETQNPTLEDMRTQLDNPAIAHGVRDTGGRVTLSIFDCKKPVIAAINGAAVGIGATMTLAMDVRLASEKARIGFVFGRLGITPEACSSWFLPRIVGISQALEWCYTADILDPQEALRGRLVKAVVAPGDLLDEARALAHRFVDHRSPVAVALTRQMLYRNAAQPHPLRAHEVDSLAIFYASRADGKEGVQAFLDKRPPEFKARASAMPPFYARWIHELDR
ncbi:MAG TPA: crotonase/enoyl-CoA hydratase family protein [Nevskiaceae bacterium]|nr:crotonase/enoyl-CoA hydratase family protein [Nevskiaceae bacterium]